MPLFVASYQHIVDANGIGLAITGMSIVFVALVLISLFLGAMPKVIAVLDGVFPPLEHHHGAAPAASGPRQPAAATIEDEAVAAIAVAMHRSRV